MAGFDVEAIDSPLSDNCFIEASAGTGKSYAIVTLFIRLLIEKELTVDQIVVVTFTRLATLELKMRLRQGIHSLLTKITNNEPTLPAYIVPYLQELSGREKSIRILKGAISGIEQAKIMTLHGFAAHLINQYGSRQAFLTEENVASPEQLERIIKDFFRTELREDDLALWQQELLLDHYKGDFEKLVQEVGYFAVQRIPIESVTFSFDELDMLKKKLIEYEMVPELIKEAVHYKGLLSRNKEIKEEALREFKKFAAWIKGETGDLRFKELFKLLPENRTQQAKKEGRIKPLYTDLVEKLQCYNDPLAIFAFVAERARLYVTHVVEKEGLIFFNDLLLQADLLIEKEEVKKGVREEFRAAFIDEFQDTDPIQWKIFSSLFLSTNSLIVVGDPKQSIYRFRQADLYTYMRAKERFAKQLSLTTNYRSGHQLVHACNQLFSLVPDFLVLPEWETSFACPEVEAKKKEGDESRLTIWAVESERQLFLLIAQEISILHKENGIKLSECAILVKDRFQMERFKEACASFSLPIQMLRENAITDSLAYHLLLDLIDVLLTPYDFSKQAKILLSPLFALSVMELEEAQMAFSSDFYGWSQVFYEKGLLASIEAMITKRSDTLFRHQNGLRIYSDLMQLVEWGIESGKKTEELLAFYRKLPKRMEGNEQAKPRPLFEQDALFAMTIHMSKGLEFRVVFPIGLIAPFTLRRQLVYSSKRKAYYIGEESAEVDAEKLRLFYVAMTRAKERLYLPFIEQEEGTRSAVSFFMSKAPSPFPLPVTSFVGQIITPPHFPLPPSPQLISQIITPPRLSSHPIASFSTLFPHQSEERKERDSPFFPTGPEVGTLLHSILEKISFRHQTEQELSMRLLPLVEGTLLDGLQDRMAALLFSTFHLCLPGGFTLAEVEERSIRKEVRFTSIKEQSAIKGVIDLFFFHQGRYYFLDWKSNHLDDYSEQSMQKEMERFHYEQQADIYRAALADYLSLFDKRPFEELFGGYYYVFIRGPGVLHGR